MPLQDQYIRNFDTAISNFRYSASSTLDINARDLYGYGGLNYQAQALEGALSQIVSQLDEIKAKLDAMSSTGMRVTR